MKGQKYAINAHHILHSVKIRARVKIYQLYSKDKTWYFKTKNVIKIHFLPFEDGTLFERTRIPFIQGCFVL